MVDIYFEHRGQVMPLPINPEELKIDVPGNNENAEVVGLGEINILKKPRLAPITISSFFPEDDDPQQYIDFFKKVQTKAEPMRIVCNAFSLNLRVGVDAFSYAMRAGEEEDRYYTLEMQEYRSYAPKLLAKTKTKAAKTVQVPLPPTNAGNGADYAVGSTVQFSGGDHYKASDATTPVGGKRTAGKAKLTNKAMSNPHPYHLIGVPGQSNVYGWVDKGQVSK